MDDKYIKDIYDNLGGESVFGDYNDYYSLITSDESYIKDIYDNLGGESVFGLYDDFVALVKKKDELQPTSQEGDTVSTIKEKTTPTSLESSENKFDYRDFLLKKEEEAKPFLEEALKGRDFSVEETGIGNALNVKDNITGETIEIDLRPAPITGNTMEQQYEKLDKLFSPEYEKKRRSVDYNKLLEESGYIEANNRDGFYMSVDFEDKKRDQHRFQNENGETIVKKAKDLSPELLTAINLYEEANKKRNTSIYAGNVDVNTRKDDEVIGSDDVPDEYLFSVGIDKDDYLKWVNKNRRKESVLYKAVKYLFKGDEEEEYFKEKTQYEKIKSYKASILNDISSDISVIDSRIKLSKDQSLKNNLKREREILQKEFLKNANQMSSAINLFPKYKEYTLDKDLERRKNLYYASRSGEKINATAQGIELGKTGFSAIHNFATGFLSIAGEMPDELLFKAGFEDKGFFKGLSEVFTDASESMDASFGPVQRRTVAEGKTVFYKNQEYIVGKNGSVLDSKTNVSVKGIISDEDIKEIIKRSKNIKDTDLNLTVGSGLQGTTQTLANLVALIRTGGKTTKALGLKGSKAGAYGMGIASYMSSVTSSVEDIRSQLVESGMSEQEALDVSISAGNAIASLDGIFSGLAGSNAKLMSGLSGIKQEIINAAKTKGKEFSSKQLKDKAYELLKENAKELFIEELPVLFSEKGINYLVNEHIGKEVLDDDINRGDIVETAILTIAATSTLGSTNLLSGNNRKDFIRGLAKDNNINLEATLNKMVLDEQITKDQAYNVYKEVSSMREADLKTSETIFMSKNVEEAADLIKQKELLQEKAKDLDGALKEDVDKKIASIDEQLKELREKDKESAKKELDAIQEQETRDIPDAERAEGVQEMEEEVRFTTEEKSKTALKISSDTKTALDNKKTKQELTVDENGNTIVNEVEISKEDANLELDRLSLLAEKGRLTVDEFQKSYFGQSTDTNTLSESKKQIESNPVEFINSIKKAFNETDTNQAVESAVKKETLITPETSSNYANLTEDNEGNFVFYHVGSEGYSQIKPRSGATKATSGEERAALSKVGGMAMYYTKASDGESMVSGSTKYEVKIPKDKVYDFNSDPLNLKKEAKQRHDAENPGKGYDDNSELAYVAKIAEEKGFDMVIAEWDGKTRAQTTKALAPNDTQVMEGNTVVKPFKNQYKSNADKGFVSVIPESKQSKLKALYNKIYKERNKQNKYDDLYRLQENSVKMSQEEITNLIEGSDISQEIKNEYKQILESEEGKRKSVNKKDTEQEEGVASEPADMPNAPKGVFLDIEMIAGKDGRKMSEGEIIDALPFDEVEVDNDGTNLRVKIPRKLSNSEMMTLMKATQQEAIGQVVDGKGVLHAQSKKLLADYGNMFNPEYFKLPRELRKVTKKSNIKELGYTNKEIAGGEITSTEIRERSEASIKAKKKKDASIATRTREKLLDRQARIKGLLKGINSKESKQAVAKIVTKAGATGYASFRFKEAEDKIYKGLSNEDSKILDEMIYESRIISINKNRADRGMDPYTGIEGYNEVSAQRDLDNKKQKLGDKKFKELKKRSDIYFTEFNKSLKRMFDSGLISEEVYNQLKDLDYSPIKTIKYIIPENSSSEEIDRVAISAGVTKDAIKNLGDSNVNDIITDTKWLLATNLSMIEAKIFENRMLNAFEDAINSATETEKIALNEYILDNPVVGKYKDGRPKRKYDDKYDNINYTKVYYKKDGVDKYFVMKKIYAEQLLDVKMKQSKTSDVISKLTGTQVLRFFATSGNPLFIVGNTAVDFNNILFLSDTYSNFKLLGGAELAYDFVSNSLGKVFASESYKKSYNEFMEHGGSIDYLSVDGLKALQNLDTGMKPIQKATDILKSYGKVLSYLGETSEISFRIAVYEKSKSNQLKKLGRKPTDQEMEDIMFEAAREARETIDFSQGGSATKAADKTLPYLNAATQGLRKGLDYANNNPAGFASSMLQAALMSGGLMAGSLLMLLSGLDDEDEIDEVLGRVSEYEKSNYHIIFTGNKDKDGEYEYYRVKKLPTISVFSTFAEQLVTKSVLKSRGIDYDIVGDVMEKSLKSAMPIIPTPKEFLQRNPLLSSVVTYATNYDFFYDKPIFQGPRGKNIAPSAEGLYDPKVNQIYKDWGQATGMSPARSKAALEKIITSESTNPVVGLIYSGYDAAFKDDTAISEDFNKAKESLFKNIGKKVRRKTNKNLKVYKERADIEEQEMIVETEIYNKEQKVYRQIVSKHKNNEELTNNELKNIVKENFDKKDWKRYYRKYYIMNKKKDVDRGLLDILYENTPEVQALKLFKRFGNSLDAEEYKELRKVSKAARRNLSKKAYKIYKDKYTK